MRRYIFPVSHPAVLRLLIESKDSVTPKLDLNQKGYGGATSCCGL